MRLYFIRHGESEANLGRYMSGQTDVSLTEGGRAQAKMVAEKLKSVEFGAVYSSDLRRAMHTAEAILEGRDLSLVTSPKLRERHFGKWEGLTFTKVQEEFPEAWGEFVRSGFNAAIPGGEAIEEFYARLVTEVEGIVEKYGRDADVNLCIVAHGCVLMALFSHYAFGSLEGYNKFSFENAKVNLVEFMSGFPVIKALNA